MPVIKSGASSDFWSIDSASKAGRVTLYDALGNPIDSSHPLAVTIQGGVTISNAVEITNDSGNPVPVSGTFYPATQPVSGTVAVSGVSGNVSSAQSGSW